MADFHFIRPEWLWAIAPLLVITWLSHKNQAKSQWQSWVSSHLSASLLGQEQSKPLQWRTYLLAAIWILSAIALAGPTFEKIEKPLFKSNRASVIVMDMSMSMRSTDITPDRLTRSRFKAIDLTTELGDGEVGLVAYAGDAFTISPLTQDPRNIAALIPSLSPEIMPVPGSYPLLGLEKAAEIMSQAGYLSGEIYWFTDGIDIEDMDDLRKFAAQSPYRINVLALGTSMGAPIKMADGTLLKDQGSIVIPKLNLRALQEISNLAGGQTISATADTSDIQALASLSLTNVNSNKDTNSADREADQEAGQQLTGDDWHEAGPWLVLFIMPMLLFVFRKGASAQFMSFGSIMFTTTFVLMTTLSPSPAVAAQDAESTLTSKQTSAISTDSSETQEANMLDKVFKTPDQLGYQAFTNGDYKTAQQRFNDQQWKAAAAYKNKDYEQALSLFSSDQSAKGWYNQGNALAHLGDLEKAIEAYSQALELDPNLEQAAKNKEILEQLKSQQEQSQSEQQSEQGQEQSGQENKGQQSDSQQQSKQNQNEQGQSDQQNSQDGPTSNADQSDPSQQQPQQGDNSDDSQQKSEQTQQDGQQGNDIEKADGQLDEEKNQTNSNKAKSPSQAMTPEEIAEQEKQQRIEQLLRKVDDNPSVLLRNKMILENKRRQYQRRYPKGVEKTW